VLLVVLVPDGEEWDNITHTHSGRHKVRFLDTSFIYNSLSGRSVLTFLLHYRSTYYLVGRIITFLVHYYISGRV